MKLEKREITLNERDSLKDIYYFGKMLITEYENALSCAERKDVTNELSGLLEGLKADTQSLSKRIIEKE